MCGRWLSKMKNIENQNIWEACVETLSKFDLLNHESCCQLNIILKDTDKKKTLAEISELASYTYERDIETGKISQMMLSRMEENGEIVGSHIFSRMARHYYLMEKVTRRDYSKKRTLCATIHAHLGNNYFFSPKEEVIGKVLEIGTKLMSIEKYDLMTNDYSEGIVKAIEILQGYEINIGVLYDSIDCNEKTNNAIFELLEKKIMSVGGLAVLVYLGEKYFFNNFVPVIDRYMISRSIDNKQSVPIQLLISMAIKHLNINDINYNKKDSQCIEIIDLAQSWYNIWDVEGETGMEYAMGRAENYPLELFNQIIVDKFCVPKQYNKEYILSSLDHMIKPLFLLCNKKYSYDDYRKVTCYLMNQPCFIYVIDIKKMKKKVDVANYKIDMILEDMSIPAIRVNSEFTSLDASCNHYKWPLIQFPMKRYVYIDYHICGFGFYNVAYEIIKENCTSIDKIQGEYVEDMLKDELKKKKYYYLCGKYSELKKKKLGGSECDLIMQDKNTFFFELKKTAITNELDNLDDVTMLQQLAKGMVKAQKQCFLHELYLKSNGSICLDDNGFRNIVYPASEQDCCFKISVCHQEYSFLTSKNFCTLLLETILLGGFGVKDPGRKDDLNKLNNFGKQIFEIIRKNKETGKVVVRDEVFYSLFCSLQQILIALWNSEDENDFLDMIKEWIYCQDKSLDAYLQILTHIYHRKHPEKPNLKKEVIEMFERTGKKCMFIG